MAYENFIAEVEAKKLLKERDTFLCLGEHCTREWEGEIKKQGDSVVVKGFGRPTIYNINKNGTYAANGVGTGSIAGKGKDIIQKGIPDPEELTGYEKKFEVNQIALFNFLVGDIDEQLSSEKGLIAKTRPKTAQDIAEEQDKRIRDVIIAEAGCAITGSINGAAARSNGYALTSGNKDTSTNGSNKVNILDAIDEVVLQLRMANVKDSEKIWCEVSPKFLRCLKIALRKIDSNNSKIVRNREVVSYNGLDFIGCNIMQKDATNDYAFFRTGDSVAFFDPLTKEEAYRPEHGFSDAVKGFNLYDAGVMDKSACKYLKIDTANYEY